MSENTSDNDDLTPTQEYTVAGAVILFFGLLYWYLNPGLHSNSDINLAGAQLPQADLALTSHKYPSTLESFQPPATTATASSNASAGTAVGSDATTTAANNINTTQAAPVVATTAMPPASVAAPSPTPAVADAAKSSLPAIATTAVVEIPPKPAEAVSEPRPVETVTDHSRSLVYTLPDGSSITIGSSGFEAALKHAIENHEINKPIIFDNIRFDSGSTAINADSTQQIKATAALLYNNPSIKLLIRGHTDEVGAAHNNAELSLMRANEMGLALVNLGIDRQRLRIMGMGNTDPIATNETEEGRTKNRRIDAMIIQ
jgi:outer membrane protein OmpA-like peptidoglycan-associated protein